MARPVKRRGRRLRVLVLMHSDLVPPENFAELEPNEAELYRTEHDVVEGLRALGHDVLCIGLYDELAPLRQAIHDAKPHIAFNLLEEFRGEPIYDHAVVSYLELMRVPYTGCNPRGMILARDKALSKKILHYHRIRVPRFTVVPLGRPARRPAGLDFPLIVKSLNEESSAGISQAAVVGSDTKLADRVAFMHRNVGTDAIVEQYVDGREIYCGVIGNARLEALPPWELFLEKLPADAPKIATRRIKWDLGYQQRMGVESGPAEIPEAQAEYVRRVSKRIYRLLDMSGYGRIDFRLASDGHPYFLEANPNADVAAEQEFANSADAAGYSYPRLLERILEVGLRRAGR